MLRLYPALMPIAKCEPDEHEENEHAHEGDEPTCFANKWWMADQIRHRRVDSEQAEQYD